MTTTTATTTRAANEAASARAKAIRVAVRAHFKVKATPGLPNQLVSGFHTVLPGNGQTMPWVNKVYDLCAFGNHEGLATALAWDQCAIWFLVHYRLQAPHSKQKTKNTLFHSTSSV